MKGIITTDINGNRWAWSEYILFIPVGATDSTREAYINEYFQKMWWD